MQAWCRVLDWNAEFCMTNPGVLCRPGAGCWTGMHMVGLRRRAGHVQHRIHSGQLVHVAMLDEAVLVKQELS